VFGRSGYQGEDEVTTEILGRMVGHHSDSSPVIALEDRCFAFSENILILRTLSWYNWMIEGSIPSGATMSIL